MTVQKVKECLAVGPGGIPKSIPKSGRKWKVQETERSSAKTRKGVLKHMSTTFEQKMILKEQRDRTKQLEGEMKNEKKEMIEEAKRLAVDREARRAANQIKSTAYQVVCEKHIVYFILNSMLIS